MKKTLLCLFASGAFMLSACASDTGSSTPSKTVSAADLQHHNFILKTFNGKTITGKNQTKQPRIEFNENMRINGVVCNNFNGQATLEKGVLKAQAASTMMLCEADLNEAEQALFKGLDAGLKVSLNGEILTLKDNTNTFVYQRRDYVN